MSGMNPPNNGQPGRRNSASEVWQYFSIVTFGDEHKVRCVVCNQDLAYTPGVTGTSAMRQHLSHTHEILLSSQTKGGGSLENVGDVPPEETSWGDFLPDARRGKKSKVWNFFRLIEYGDERYSRCVMCRADLKYHGSTTAMLHHLRAKHSVAFEQGYPPRPTEQEDGDNVSESVGTEADPSPRRVMSVNRQQRASTGMGRNKSSVVWKFFKVVYFGPDKRTRCDLCGSDMAYHDGTTAMHKHLERKHPREYAQGEKAQDIRYEDGFVFDDGEPGEMEEELLVSSPAQMDAVLSQIENDTTESSPAPNPDSDKRTRTPSKATKPTRETPQSQENLKPLRVSLNKETIKSLLRESITTLCRDRLLYDVEVSVEALIGVTVDKREVVLVNINDTLFPEEEQTPPSSSTRGQKRSAQAKAQGSSKKKKSKRGRSRSAPKESPVSLQIESFNEEEDADWEPVGGAGGGRNTRKGAAQAFDRARRVRKRVSYRESHDKDDGSNDAHEDDDMEYGPDNESEEEVEVKQETEEGNPAKPEERVTEEEQTSQDQPSHAADSPTGRSTDTSRVEMAVKSCVICNKIYMATEHLNHHMVVQHGLGEDKRSSAPRPQQQDEVESITAQTNIKSFEPFSGQSVRCKYCGETLSANQMARHLVMSHPGENIPYDGPDANVT